MNENELNVLKRAAEKLRSQIVTEQGRISTWAKDPKENQARLDAGYATLATLKGELTAVEVKIKLAEIDLLEAG